MSVSRGLVDISSELHDQALDKIRKAALSSDGHGCPSTVYLIDFCAQLPH
jgi:hypothetical protein